MLALAACTSTTTAPVRPISTVQTPGPAKTNPSGASSAGGTFTALGLVRVTNHLVGGGRAVCEGAANGYADVHDGAEVDVVDGAGKVVGFGTLGSCVPNASDPSIAIFQWEADDIPSGLGIYGVQIGGNSGRGIVHFTEAQMHGTSFVIDLGN
jgi:hypothetical protein